MTPIDAFNFTLTKIFELKENGIDVKLTPIRSKISKELIGKYNKPERIPSEKWLNVSFKINSENDAVKIHEMANYLGLCWICFDTGGCSVCRDWELDWSFRYVKGDEDREWREARERVEELISELMPDNQFDDRTKS